MTTCNTCGMGGLQGDEKQCIPCALGTPPMGNVSEEMRNHYILTGHLPGMGLGIGIVNLRAIDRINFDALKKIGLIDPKDKPSE